MINVNAIRNDNDLKKALSRIEEIFDAEPGSKEEEELEILTALVQAYEAKCHPVPDPDPISAIKFRMEQANLTAADLVPMIGSKPRVYEILSGRRPITMEMARALHANLGIPAEVLLAPPKSPEITQLTKDDYRKFPVKEMAARGWINPQGKDGHETEIDRLIDRAGGPHKATTLFRQGNSPRLSAKSNPYALQAWVWQVAGTALENEPSGAYCPEDISADFLNEIARLSQHANGPARAKELLDENGIAMVYTLHLPKTYLDGAAFISAENYPVIGITGRYDRVDNFWFTLLHELAHVSLHLRQEGDKVFLDDLDLNGGSVELDTDELARDCLIPTDKWEELQGRSTVTVNEMVAFAQDLGINPAIVAGRIRHERKNYKLFSQFVGNGEVRKHLT